MLVVMAIIAILISLGFVGATAAINAAKRGKANTIASQIQAASLSYFTEYNVYPVPTGTQGDYSIEDTDGGSWGSLLIALCGNHNTYSNTSGVTSSVPNPRNIAFLSLKSSDVDSSNAPLNPLPTGSEIYFNITMDSDYDGSISANMPSFANGTFSSGGGSSSAGVAVWANCNGSTSSNNAAFYVHTY
jgi:type II secretory pathway pseudopilin PulG